LVLLTGMRQYTDPARGALVLAEDEAIARCDSAVGTCHILLGLLSDRDCVASKALSSLGISAEAMRPRLGELIPSEEGGISSYGISVRIAFTKGGLRVLSLAMRELPQTGHASQGQKRTAEGQPYICTGEILLGILDLRAMAAAQEISRLGIDVHAAHEQVTEFVRHFPADEPVSDLESS
jgi:ATP-dependent Clp protease ATP-binding subunit ClpC